MRQRTVQLLCQTLYKGKANIPTHFSTRKETEKQWCFVEHVLSGLWVQLQPVLWSFNRKVQCVGKWKMKKMEIHTFLVWSCVVPNACVCVRARACALVHVYVCDVSVCHRVSSFPFTAPWQQCQTRPHMICVCLWEYVCVCVWVDSVFILLSSPFHLRSLGCSGVLSNGQSRPAKLAFGSGTELDAWLGPFVAHGSWLRWPLGWLPGRSWVMETGEESRGSVFTPCCSHLPSIAPVTGEKKAVVSFGSEVRSGWPTEFPKLQVDSSGFSLRCIDATSYLHFRGSSRMYNVHTVQ